MALASLLVLACVPHEEEPPWVTGEEPPEAVPDGGALSYAVPPPPFSKKSIYPCTDCHNGVDVKLNRERRELEEHTKISEGLKHGGEDRWCFDCHNPEDRDHLRLANGTLVEFKESYRLCGQCHGEKYRDWKAGVHGKRTGSWSGEKQYLLCAHCHDPHQPHFKSLKPLPPPVAPVALP